MGDDTVPLQPDMFTGKLRDTRTRRQKEQAKQERGLQQTVMFSQRDMAQFGVRSRPLMDLHPGRLALIMEDPRTPEEIAADIQREAERRTTPMFGKLPGDSDMPSEVVQAEPDTETDPDSPIMLPHERLGTTDGACLAVMEAAYDAETTLWIDAKHRLAFADQLTRAILDAKEVGLDTDSISKAVQIGQAVGQKARAEAPALSELLLESTHAPRAAKTPYVGLRARLRAEQTGVRTR